MIIMFGNNCIICQLIKNSLYRISDNRSSATRSLNVKTYHIIFCGMHLQINFMISNTKYLNIQIIIGFPIGTNT